MAKIQIDFDQVMRFGGLHGDIGRSIDAQRNVFRGDSNHLDQVMAAFGLARAPGGTTFQGMSIAGAMGDADARAGRVAHTLLTSSNKIFNYAGANQAIDSHFNWGGSVARAFWGPMTGPFGSHLAGMFGGELAGKVATGVVWGVRMSRGLSVLVPVFAGVTGVLDLVDAYSGIRDAGSDRWMMAAAVLKGGAGALGLGVALGAGAVIVVAGAAAGATAAAAAAPVLLVAGLLSVAALGIENRHQIGQIATDAARGIGGAVKALTTTASEAAHDLLAGAGNIWNKTVQLATATDKVIRDVVFATAGELRNALTNVVHNLTRPLNLVPTSSAAPGWVISMPGAVLSPGGALQGSGPTLQGGSTAPLQGPSQAPNGPSPTPSAAPATTVPKGVLPDSQRSWEDAQRAYDQKVPGYVAANLMYDDTLPTIGENRYQCVSWAWFRMRELGYEGPRIQGWGGVLAGYLGGSVSTEPKLGAVVSSSGHVFVVEELERDSTGRVTRARYSEMNSGQHADGTDAPDGGSIVASADEFRSDNWIELKPDGTFQRVGEQETLVIFNPDYPW